MAGAGGSQVTSRLLVVIWLLIFARVAEAIFLPVPVSVHSIVQQSSDVFMGVVRSAKTSGSVVKGHVFIEKSWKGARAGRTVIVEAPLDGECGVHLRPGMNVLVFAHPGTGHAKGSLSTTFCRGSMWWPPGATEIGNVTALIDSLGPPVSVAEVPSK